MDSSDNLRDENSIEKVQNLNLDGFPTQELLERLEEILESKDDWPVPENKISGRKSNESKSRPGRENRKNNSSQVVDRVIDIISSKVVRWNKDFNNFINDYEEKTDQVISRQVVLAKLRNKEVVIMKTLEYFLEGTDRAVVSDIINFAYHHHVQMKVTSETILSLLFKFPNKDAEFLVKLLVEKGVQLVYLEQEDGFKRSSSQGSPSKRNLDRGNPSKRSLAIEELEALADGKGNDEEEEEEEKEAPEFQAKINGDDQMTKHERESSNFETAGYFNPEGLQRAVYLHQEYLGLHHALEIMFRSNQFTDEQELIVFEGLYNGRVWTLKAGPLAVSLMIAYDRNELFITLCHHLHRTKLSDREQKMNSDIMTSSMNTLIYANVASYKFEDMTLDGIKFSLMFDNIKFLEYILTKYEQESAMYPFSIGSYIVSSLGKRLSKKQLFPYISEKLRNLEKISSLNTAKTTTINQLITLLHDILDLEPRLSIFANVYNPFRLFILIVKMLQTLKSIVNNMDGVFEKLYERLEQYIINIIDN